MKIYTRTGDQGRTRLVGGTQVSKSHLRLDAYGSVDELNSQLGMVRLSSATTIFEQNKDLTQKTNAQKPLNPMWDWERSLQMIQNELFSAGSLMACEDAEWMSKMPHLQKTSIQRLEQEIDQMGEVLAPLREFILPGGCERAARLHVARTVCRRAERLLVALLDSVAPAPQATMSDTALIQTPLQDCEVYLNRLSDWLFVAARRANWEFGIADQKWIK